MIAVQESNVKNKYGQYFTPGRIAAFMISLANLNNSSTILEPSCGEGVFIEELYSRGFYNVTGYEVDACLGRKFDCVIYESFVAAEIEKKFDLVIGNPPYIRWKNLEAELKKELETSVLWQKYFNSLCDYLHIFILKSVELLNENGQLIFICPEYWLTTTHSMPLRNYLVKNGYFESIYHFNEAPIFDNAAVSLIVFKYIKSKGAKPEYLDVAKFYKPKRISEHHLTCMLAQKGNDDIQYFKIPQFELNKTWVLQDVSLSQEIHRLEESCRVGQGTQQNIFVDESSYCTIGHVCDIGNGLVSGLDKAFQLCTDIRLNAKEKKSVIRVVKAKDISPFLYNRVTNYIFVENCLNEAQLMADYPNFYSHLGAYKSGLDNRYKYNRKINYWEWVFLRNFNLFSIDQPKIFVPCKERISHKSYFRFALVPPSIYPTQDVTALAKKSWVEESYEYILSYLNHPLVFKWMKCKGIIKGNIVEFSEKPISSIPFRRINFSNPVEVAFHKEITEKTKLLIENQDLGAASEIFNLISKLLKQ